MMVLISILIISCNEEDRIEKKRIDKFESIIGELETLYLDEIVSDFEIYLNSLYHNEFVESKYEKYLIALSKGNIADIWTIDSIKLKKYGTNSNLLGKYDSIYPDSVWFEHGMINLKFSEYETIESIIPIRRKNRAINIDSMIFELFNKPELILLEENRFYLALDSIKQNDSLIIYLLEERYLSGDINNRNLSKVLLHYNPDYSDYFVKKNYCI